MSLDPTVGAEIRKTRPAVVVQNDPANRRRPITIVAAATSQFEEPLWNDDQGFAHAEAPKGHERTLGILGAFCPYDELDVTIKHLE